MKINSRVLAIDYGSKRVGLAISDELRMLARPIGILENTNRLQKEILALVAKEQVGCVILGLPRTLAGTDSAFTSEVRTFAEKLFAKLDAQNVQHVFYDERLTSVMAQSNIAEQGWTKTKREEKFRKDEEAARIILQEWLNAQN
ncbi:MAG: Holliday junction resolvase RuvX [Bacteroidota bacterium]|nr:Holliday junction resolvase RuvX [Bacteroidota bacterium]